MKNISILVASQHYNKKLATTIRNKCNAYQVKTTLIDLVSLELPLYSPISHEKEGLHKHVSTLTSTCRKSAGFVFVAPEYNGSIPPVLTNAIAWISVSTKEWRQCFNTKPAGIATFSGSGGMQLITSLRGQLSYLGLTVIGLPLHTNHTKPLVKEDLESFVKQLVTLVSV